MKPFRPQLEALEERCTPVCVGDSCSLTVPIAGSSLTISVRGDSLGLTVADGNSVTLPTTPTAPPAASAPQSASPPEPLKQAVGDFLATNGQPPLSGGVPGPAGLFVASGLVSPSKNNSR